MKSLKGQLLVATSDLLDSNFFQTVILLFEHNDEGAAGVVLNRPIEASITDIAEQVFEAPFDWDKPIHLGGPVPGPLMILHQVSELADQEIMPGLYSTIEAQKVQEALRQRLEPSLIVANYAGWGPGQLETEISEKLLDHNPRHPRPPLRNRPPDPLGNRLRPRSRGGRPRPPRPPRHPGRPLAELRFL